MRQTNVITLLLPGDAFTNGGSRPLVMLHPTVYRAWAHQALLQTLLGWLLQKQGAVAQN
jgi:hypothetical protein